MSIPLESLYQEVILSHYRRPRHQGELDGATARIHMNNPTCGDEIELSVRLEGDRLMGIGFTGQGCSISQASASMMSDRLHGLTLDEVARMAESFNALIQGRIQPAAASELGDLRALAGVARFPARVRCALLAWNALAELTGVGGPRRSR